MIVYFIKPVGMDGPIKIGTSQSPDKRRSTLATWSPFALEIIAQIKGEGNIEGRFHAAFLKHHQRREWFDPSPELLAAIDAINDGTFDLATLPAPIRLRESGRKGKKLSPEERYRSSVMGRLRGKGVNWHHSQPILQRATGGTYRLFDNRKAIEAELAKLGCKPSSINWDEVEA